MSDIRMTYILSRSDARCRSYLLLQVAKSGLIIPAAAFVLRALGLCHGPAPGDVTNHCDMQQTLREGLVGTWA